MVNKVTGLSKGYGFVSYANPTDAQSAIESLDGFRVSNYQFRFTLHLTSSHEKQLGKKRLKVQLKRLQDDNEEEYDDWDDDAPENDDIAYIQSNFSIMSTNESTMAHSTAIHNSNDLNNVNDSTEDVGIIVEKVLAKVEHIIIAEESSPPKMLNKNSYKHSSSLESSDPGNNKDNGESDQTATASVQ